MIRTGQPFLGRAHHPFRLICSRLVIVLRLACAITSVEYALPFTIIRKKMGLMR